MAAPLRSKQLGPFDATMLVMGGILGVGIFFNPAQVAALVPSEPAFLAVWAIGGLVALCGAFTFAELGATFPRAGGWYVYLREIWGPLAAFLFAWVVLFVVSTGALAVLAGFCVGMLSGVLPWLGERGSTAQSVAAAALIAGITALAMCGLKVGATFQNACMLVKLAAVLALIAGGFLAWAARELPPAAEPLLPPPDGSGRTLLDGMLAAMLPVLFACGGWQMLGYAASEVREPARTLPRAILVGVGGVMLLYVLLNLQYVRVLGLEAMASDYGFAAELARRSFGPAGGELLRLAMAVSALGICTVIVIVTPWIYVALAREGDFFASFGRLHPRTGAPVLGLAAQCALALGYLFFVGDPDRLVSSVVFVEWIFHGLVAVGLIRLRLVRPELPRPYRSPFFPLLPLLYALIAAGVVLGALRAAQPADTRIGLVAVAAGLAVHLARRALAPHDR